MGLVAQIGDESRSTLAQEGQRGGAGIQPVRPLGDTGTEFVVGEEARVLDPGNRGGVDRLLEGAEALAGEQRIGLVEHGLEYPFGALRGEWSDGCSLGIGAKGEHRAVVQFHYEHHRRGPTIHPNTVEFGQCVPVEPFLLGPTSDDDLYWAQARLTIPSQIYICSLKAFRASRWLGPRDVLRGRQLHYVHP